MRAVAAILLFMSGITARAETAETIFINGNIYTVNEKQPHAEAIAVKAGSHHFRWRKCGCRKIPGRQNAHR